MLFVFPLFFLGLAGLFLAFLIEKKNTAKKGCLKLSKYIATHESFFNDLSQHTDKGSYDAVNLSVFNDMYMYLIYKDISGINLTPLNNDKIEYMSNKEYNRLSKKLAKQSVIYTYTMESYSLFCLNSFQSNKIIMFKHYYTNNEFGKNKN